MSFVFFFFRFFFLFSFVLLLFLFLLSFTFSSSFSLFLIVSSLSVYMSLVESVFLRFENFLTSSLFLSSVLSFSWQRFLTLEEICI